MNWIDRAISVLSPSLALERERSRMQLAAIGSYEGARRSRMTKNWRAGMASANEDIRYDLIQLRERSRDLVRNSPYGEKAMTMLASKMVSTGIRPRIPSEYPQLVRLWREFVANADFDGNTNWYGLQSLAARTMAESGEALMVERPSPRRLGLSIPLQYQVLEPDFIDSRKNARETQTGGRIVQGIELDASGRRVAYWLYDRHPGDVWHKHTHESRRVPAAQVIHLYEIKRPGQLRGVPWLAPVMLKLKNLDDFDDAELMAKKIQSCVGLAIQTSGEGLGGVINNNNQSGLREEEMKPGMILRPKPGEQVEMLSPKMTLGYEKYVSKHLHDIATGLRVTYEDLTGDLSQVNYSSYRAGQIAIREWIDQLRQHLLIPRGCAPVWQRFAELAEAIHGAETPDSISWSTPRWSSLDLQKDVRAEKEAIRSGLKSLPEAISDFGGDPQEVLSSIEQTNDQLDARGIVLDSDARNRTLNGAGIKDDQTNEEEQRDAGN